MELANCFSIPILPPFVHFSISQLRLGMMERCREMMGLLQPAWLSTAVPRPQSSGGWCSEVYNNYPSIWVSGGTATWQGTEIFLFQQGPEVYDCGQWLFFLLLLLLDRNRGWSKHSWSVVGDVKRGFMQDDSQQLCWLKVFSPDWLLVKKNSVVTL